MQPVRTISLATCVVLLGGCGGGSSTPEASTVVTAAETQYSPRLPKVGDERVFQFTDTYSDGTVRTYTEKKVVTQIGPDGSYQIRIFDANNNLIEINAVDGNHIYSTTAGSPSGARTCTDGQPRPAFAKPYTVGESIQSHYTGNCTPDGLTAVVDVSGKIIAVETVPVNGADYLALKDQITVATTVTYPEVGTTNSFTYTDLQTDWVNMEQGVVRSDFTRTYLGTPPSLRLTSRSLILISYVNK